MGGGRAGFELFFPKISAAHRRERKMRKPWSLVLVFVPLGTKERKVKARCGHKTPTFPQLTEGHKEFQDGEREGGRRGQEEGRGGEQAVSSPLSGFIPESIQPLLSAPWDWAGC